MEQSCSLRERARVDTRKERTRISAGSFEGALEFAFSTQRNRSNHPIVDTMFTMRTLMKADVMSIVVIKFLSEESNLQLRLFLILYYRVYINIKMLKNWVIKNYFFLASYLIFFIQIKKHITYYTSKK